jgi:hypothetical protein
MENALLVKIVLGDDLAHIREAGAESQTRD